MIRAIQAAIESNEASDCRAVELVRRWLSTQSTQTFLAFFGLNETPSRSAMRLIASGGRPSCFAASSSEIEDFASSMSRRSSLNDQGLRAIFSVDPLVHKTKAAKRMLNGLLGWAGHFESPVKRGIGDLESFATNTGC